MDLHDWVTWMDIEWISGHTVTAWSCCKAGIPKAWADALQGSRPEDTAATRAFSGRLGRSLKTVSWKSNPFVFFCLRNAFPCISSSILQILCFQFVPSCFIDSLFSRKWMERMQKPQTTHFLRFFFLRTVGLGLDATFWTMEPYGCRTQGLCPCIRGTWGPCTCTVSCAAGADYRHESGSCSDAGLAEIFWYNSWSTCHYMSTRSTWGSGWPCFKQNRFPDKELNCLVF